MSEAARDRPSSPRRLDLIKRRTYTVALSVAGIAATIGYLLESTAVVPGWARLVFGPGIAALCVLVAWAMNTKGLDMRTVEKTSFALVVVFLAFRIVTVLFLSGPPQSPSVVLQDFSPWLASVFIFAFVALPNRTALPAAAGIYFTFIALGLGYLLHYGFERVEIREVNYLVQGFIVANAFTITMLFFLARTKEELSRERTERLVMSRLAHTDELTGLANRRFILQSLERELARASREGGPVSLVMFDLDHFKAVNDEFGHATGDAVLRRVAAVARERLRTSDEIGRYGGEEFLLLAIGAELAMAAQLAERLRAAFEADSTPGTPRFTASFGVSTWRPGEPLMTVLGRADDALYLAKYRGRNRVMTEADLPPRLDGAQD